MQYRNSSLSQKCNKRRIGRWRDPFKVWMMNCFQSPGPSTPNVQWVLTTFFFQPRSPLSQTAWCGWNSGPPTLRVYMDLCLSLSLWHKRERESKWWLMTRQVITSPLILCPWSPKNFIISVLLLRSIQTMKSSH